MQKCEKEIHGESTREYILCLGGNVNELPERDWSILPNVYYFGLVCHDGCVSTDRIDAWIHKLFNLLAKKAEALDVY